MRMKRLTKKQTIELCKVDKANHNRTKQKLCKCICCEEETEEPLPTVYTLIGRIGFNACNGRCSDIPFPEEGSTLMYSTGPVFEIRPGFFIPFNGALLFYDEELTLPVTNLGLFSVLFTGCRFGNFNELDEFFYTECF